MDKPNTKPKLVFFQWQHEDLPKYLSLHLQEHIKCLSESFEVTVIREDCDYQEICDKYQPDLTLFESGVYAINGSKKEIKNISAYPEIPRLGFLHADAYCNSRQAFISDMESWGVETFFTLSVSAGEYTPEIAENLFFWPNFVDGELYREYGQSKVIPVLLTGSVATHYPWRNRVAKIVSQYYPSLVSPHFGWHSQRASSRMVFGEQYAKMLNASWFVPACGTIAKEVVRKHFEIPASKACLIAERTLSLEAAGFVDMQNCVFADEHDILDKLDYLFQNLDELEKIINTGYNLIHSRHTLKHRNQIFQWFSLYKNLKPNQKIVQLNPFEPLVVREASSNVKKLHIINNGLDRILLRKGDEELWAGNYDKAEPLYLQCLNYQSLIPEPKFRLSICNLYKGNAEKASDWILQPIKNTLEEYKALEPDPVEWAYFIISLLCQGKLDKAVECSKQFPLLRHIEIDRTRWVIKLLNGESQDNSLESGSCKYRYSLHQLPSRSIDDWIDNLCIMLKASQQFELATKLTNSFLSEVESKSLPKNYISIQNILKNFSLGRIGVTPKIASLKERWLKSKIRRLVLKPLKKFSLEILNHLEDIFGYFLPYRFSKMKSDEFFCAVQKLAREENIKTALLIGFSNGEGSTEAFLAGIQENPNRPKVFLISTEKTGFVKLPRRSKSDGVTRSYNISSNLSENISDEVGALLEKIQEDNQLNTFDLILIDGSELNFEIQLNKISKAEFIFIDDINMDRNYNNFQKLLADSNYTLIAENPSLRNGYAIFRRCLPRI